jgi:hypothetical protein
MMDPSEKNSFDEQWKKAFQEASEIPPLSAWKGIEARLDKEEEKVAPLWWKTPRYWYAAASVAALLLVGVGLWNGSYNLKNNATVKQTAAKQKETELPDGQDTGKETLRTPENTSEQLTGSEPAIARTEPHSPAVAKGNKTEVYQGRSGENDDRPESGTNAIASSAESNTKLPGFAKEDQSIVSSADIKSKKDQGSATGSGEPVNLVGQDVASRILAEALTPIGYKGLDVYFQKRYIFFKPGSLDNSAPEKTKKREEYWANVDLMPASFNPNIKVITAPSAYAYANAARQSLTGTSHPGNSYAIQTQGARRISKHWSLESGVSYLQGNSTYQGGGYLLDAATSRSENVLQSALADKAAFTGADNVPANSPVTGAGNYLSSNTLYIDLNKEVRNDYRFIQVPVQAGFTLRPEKKISYSVLGGMTANFFMNNEIESASGTVITTKVKDDVYRNLNYAATTGLRLNYRLSDKLKATLSGTYQKFLLSGFKNNETLESYPSLYGVAWGVRYSF